jgi:hypothetical protein
LLRGVSWGEEGIAAASTGCRKNRSDGIRTGLSSREQ